MTNVSYSPDFDKMYQDPMSNMTNSAHTQEQMISNQPNFNQEPMAANEALGGFAAF
jgi:hypothetical protein